MADSTDEVSTTSNNDNLPSSVTPFIPGSDSSSGVVSNSSAQPSETPAAAPPAQKLNGSSYILNADAQAILEAAPNLSVGLDLLSSAYNARDWDNPEKAKTVAAQYGTYLRQKFKDAPTYAWEDTLHLAPLSLSGYAATGDASHDSLIKKINSWEKDNTDFLNKTDDPDYLVIKDKLLKGIADTASSFRQQNTGGMSGGFTNFLKHAEAGAVDGIFKLFGADSYVKSLKEQTDPRKDEDLSSMLGGGVGIMGTAALATVATLPLGGIGGPIYLGLTGLGEIKQSYKDTLANTGDSGRATIAAGLQTANQAVQIGVGIKIFGGVVGKSVGNAIFGLGEEAADTFAQTALKEGATLAATAVGTAPLTTGAALQSSNKSQAEIAVDAFKSIGSQGTMKGAVVGAMLGTTAAGVKTAVSTPTRDNPYNPTSEGYFSGFLQEPDQQVSPPPIIKNVTGAPPKQVSTDSTTPTTAPDFVTVDGSGYSYTSDGKSTTRVSGKDAAPYYPLDNTFFVDKETAVNLARLKNTPNTDGTEPQFFVQANRLFVKNVKNNPLVQDGTIKLSGKKQEVYAPQFLNDAEVGAYPVQVNSPRNPNGNARVYQSLIGQEITQINNPLETQKPQATAEADAANEVRNTYEGSSVGAAYAGELKTRKVAERLLASPNVAESIKEDIAAHSAEYFVLPNAKVADEASNYIREEGIVGATNRIINRGEHETSPLLRDVAAQLVDMHNTAALNAEKAGDFEGAKTIAANAGRINDAYMEMSTLSAQTLQHHNALIARYPHLYTMGLEKKAESSAREKALSEVGTTIDAHNTAKNELADTQTSIEVLKTKADELASKVPKVEGQPEVKPETLLQPPEQQRLENLQTTEKELTKKVKAVEDKVQKEVVAKQPQINKVRDLLRQAREMPAGRNRDELLKRAFKEEVKVVGENVESPETKGNPDKGRGWAYSYWLANQISSAAVVSVKIQGDIINSASTAAALTATGAGKLTPLDGARYILAFGKALKDYGADIYLTTLKTGESLRKESTDLSNPEKEVITPKAPDSRDIISNRPDWRSIKLPGLGDKTFNADWLSKGLSTPGWIVRNLNAIENVYYRSNAEAAANVLALRAARSENPNATTEQLRTAVGEKLYNSSKNWEDAVSQAEKEADILRENGIKTDDRTTRLRAAEIIQSLRSSDIEAPANTFALGELYSKTPTGYIGDIIKGIRTAAQAPISLFGGKVIRPGKYELSFLNTLGNSLNFAKEFIPFFAWANPRFRDQNITPLEREVSLGRLITGTVAGATLFGLAASNRNDKDPYFTMYGAGPQDEAGKQTFRDSGAIPWSIKIGNQYIDAKDSVIGLYVGGLGTILDGWRADPNMDVGRAISLFVAGTGTITINRTFLSHLGKLYDALTASTNGKGVDVDKVMNVVQGSAVNTIKGFIPFAGSLRTITKIMDHPIESYQDLTAKIFQGIPAAQSWAGKPTLNNFGEPTEDTWEKRLDVISRFHSDRVIDPQTRWLVENGYGFQIPWSVQIPEIKDTGIPEERSKNLGAHFASILTPGERYQLVEKVGPQLREIVKSYQSSYGSAKYDGEVQKQLSKDISQAIKQTKIEMFAHHY